MNKKKNLLKEILHEKKKKTGEECDISAIPNQHFVCATSDNLISPTVNVTAL